MIACGKCSWIGGQAGVRWDKFARLFGDTVYGGMECRTWRLYTHLKLLWLKRDFLGHEIYLTREESLLDDARFNRLVLISSN